ncbi:helix-turn-helix transcriptional regulator [Micromonospora sp. NPDC048843]|uniref:helix-turn-helix domain-containing protein n=1 Tax=Micromonospora sp. NPDC048843 TaxID=3155389 RepID=UPI0034092CE3
MTHTDTSSAEQQFGAQVREAREIRGWSQEGLARHLRESAGLELHQTAIARLERGERAIRFNEVTALAKLLGLDLQTYSGTLPALTESEYEWAQEQLAKLRAEEERTAREWERVVMEQDSLLSGFMEARREAVGRRRAMEAMIRAYEERRDG